VGQGDFLGLWGMGTASDVNTEIGVFRPVYKRLRLQIMEAASASEPRAFDDGQRVVRPVSRRRAVVPAGPEDWGLFGPDSVSWRVHRSSVLLCGGLRALITQSFHPHAMAGVDQHSNYLERPLDRLKRTAQYVSTVVFGDSESALAAAERVKRVHLKVRGVDPITGEEYSAGDTASLLWVHCAEVHSFLASFRAYGGAIDEGEQDRYLAEQVVAAELLDIPGEMVPATRAEYREYFAEMRPRICVTEASRRAIDLCVSPPLTRELLPLQAPLRVLANAAIAITPRYMRRTAGLERARWRYASAGAVTRAAGKVLHLPGFREMPRAAIGGRTLAVARGAIEAAERIEP
jgi:uncharacterized protein (DUF2236 family)